MWPSASACWATSGPRSSGSSCRNRLSKDFSLDQRIGDVRQGVAKGIHQIDDLAETAVQFVETTLQPLEDKLPSSVTQVTTKAKQQAREVRIQIRQRVSA